LNRAGTAGQQTKTTAGEYAQELLLVSPEDLELLVKPWESQGVRGLGAILTNRGIRNLGKWQVVVADARSFDEHKSAYREGYGFNASVGNSSDILAGHTASVMWLVRIQGERLIVGWDNDRVLQWPNADSSETQTWLLSVRVGVEGLPDWKFDIRIVWSPQSGELRAFAPNPV
jgi:hypothetical protein